MLTNILTNAIWFQLPAAFLITSRKLDSNMRQLFFACAAALPAANSATSFLETAKTNCELVTEGEGGASQLTEGEVWYKNGLEIHMKFVILTTWNNFFFPVKTKQKTLISLKNCFSFTVPCLSKLKRNLSFLLKLRHFSRLL